MLNLLRASCLAEVSLKHENFLSYLKVLYLVCAKMQSDIQFALVIYLQILKTTYHLHPKAEQNMFTFTLLL